MADKGESCLLFVGDTPLCSTIRLTENCRTHSGRRGGRPGQAGGGAGGASVQVDANDRRPGHYHLDPRQSEGEGPGDRDQEGEAAGPGQGTGALCGRTFRAGRRRICLRLTNELLRRESSPTRSTRTTRPGRSRPTRTVPRRSRSTWTRSTRWSGGRTWSRVHRKLT